LITDESVPSALLFLFGAGAALGFCPIPVTEAIADREDEHAGVEPEIGILVQIQIAIDRVMAFALQNVIYVEAQ
jgi:hypothetical protein